MKNFFEQEGHELWDGHVGRVRVVVEVETNDDLRWVFGAELNEMAMDNGH
jgi:hypothetical protein